MPKEPYFGDFRTCTTVPDTTAIHRCTTLPATPPTVCQAVRWIAQLGGFLGRKGDGEPGITTIWRGWSRLADMADLYLITHPSEDSGNS
jgi:hypothetical protein